MKTSILLSLLLWSTYILGQENKEFIFNSKVKKEFKIIYGKATPSEILKDFFMKTTLSFIDTNQNKINCTKANLFGYNEPDKNKLSYTVYKFIFSDTTNLFKFYLSNIESNNVLIKESGAKTNQCIYLPDQKSILLIIGFSSVYKIKKYYELFYK